MSRHCTICRHDCAVGLRDKYGLLRELENMPRAISVAIGDDPDPGLTGEALDAWNAATARAINIARNWGKR